LKTPSSFIWQFVHSLTNAEKTFFRRNFSATNQKGQKLYLKLFDAIAAQKKYDEEKIIARFSPDITKRNISFQKNYLQTQMNDALVSYYSRNNVYQEIYKQIQLIRVFRKKGLLDEAHTLWKKAMSRARKAESFAMSSLLKSEFEKMILFSSSHISYDELHTVFGQNAITYPEYTDMITLRDIYTEVVLMKRKVHYDIDDIQREKFTNMLAGVNKYNAAETSASFWFRHYYYMSKATLLYLLNDIKGSFEILKSILTDWKKKPFFIITNGEHYLELLYMINYAGIHCGEYEYVLNAFDDKNNELIEDKMQRANFEAIKFLAHNKIFNKTARYDDVKKLIGYMKTRYQQWESLLNNDINRTVNLSLGIASFVLELYDDALYFTKRAVAYFKDGAREEHSAVAQVLLLLITYNINNSRLFDAQYRNTYTYFYKRKKKQQFETTLVQCLHRSFYIPDSKDKVKEYQKALDFLEQNKNNVIQQMAFGIFNYPGWLQSKVQRISYRQFVEKKVRAENMVMVS
jgi:hypothetical protein